MGYLVFDLKLMTTSPMYSGEIKLDRKGEIKLCRITGDGRVAFPIYGVLRGYLERILKESGEDVCDTGAKDAKPCGRCVLCDLFGSLGKKGRAIIDDMVSEKPYREIVHPAVHLRVNREKGTVSNTLRIEEIEEEGAIFRGKIRIIDPKPRDEELIKAGLRAIEEFGIGGWTTRGRERVKIEYSIHEKEWSDFLKEAKEIVSNL